MAETLSETVPRLEGDVYLILMIPEQRPIFMGDALREISAALPDIREAGLFFIVLMIKEDQR